MHRSYSTLLLILSSFRNGKLLFFETTKPESLEIGFISGLFAVGGAFCNMKSALFIVLA